jgi:glycosyltransferase involved in cell wall biosynthesis
MLAWSLPDAGWQVSVLTAGRAFQRPEWLDDQGAVFFPPHTEVHEVAPSGDWLWSRLGVGGIGWRAFLPLLQRGRELLREGRFDLVYLSATQFNLFCLGPLWKRLCGVPYVLDFHDPWYRPGERITTGGAAWKSGLGNRLSRYMEAFAVKGASGVVSVSPEYLGVLRTRYPKAEGLAEGRAVTIPFAVREEDFAAVSKSAAPVERSPTFDVVYVGVGAEIMAKSFRAIAESAARLRRSGDPLVERLRIRLFGTDGRWRDGRPRILREVAAEAGAGDLVEEQPTILPYRKALELAAGADGLLVLGVDDPAYMPSKLFLYASTGKPLLASMRHDSQVNGYFAKYGDLGRLMSFGATTSAERRNDEALRLFLQDMAEGKRFARTEARRDFSAKRMAEQHAELFEKVAAPPR